MWMSDAPSFAAWNISEFTQLMIGAEPLAREVDRQLVDQLDRDVLGARQIAQVRHVELMRERERELILVDQLEPHEHLADQAAFLALLREPALDRVRRDLAMLHEDLA